MNHVKIHLDVVRPASAPPSTAPHTHRPLALAALCCAAAVLGLVTARTAPARPAARAAVLANPDGLHITGQLGGITRAVAIEGDHAYLGVGPRLRMYGSCGHPLAAPMSETAPLPGVIEDIAVHGTTAWVAMGAAGVWSVDVSRPSQLRPIGRDGGPATFQDVPVETHRLTVDPLGRRWSATNVGLVVVGPAHTTHLPSPPPPAPDTLPPGAVHDVAVDGVYGYAAWGAYGLWIFHIDAQDRVQRVANVALANAQAVAVADGVAWVADGAMLRAFDVGDPSHPSALGEVVIDPAGGDGRAIALRGTTVLVALARAPGFTAALAAVDGSDTGTPVVKQVETWPAALAQLDDGTVGGLGLDVAASGDLVIIGGDVLGHRSVELDRWLDGDRTAFDAPTTEAVVPRALQMRTDTPSAWLANGRGGVVPTAVLGEDAWGTVAYMVRAPGLVLDTAVSDVAPLAPPGRPFGRYALVAAGRPRVIGLEPVPGVGEQLLVRSTVPELTAVEHVAVVSDVGVTFDLAAGFAVLDLADPLAPRLVARLDISDTAGVPIIARDIAVDPGGKRRAAIAAGTAVAVVDFSRREQPRLVGVAPAAGSAAVTWDVDRLWVATDAGEIVAYALGVDGAPERTSTVLALPAPAEDLALRGGRLYAALGPLGVAVVDVTAPVPVLAGVVDTPGWAGGLGIDVDGRVWAADRAAGAVVLDVPMLDPPPTLEPPPAATPTACPRPLVPRLWLPWAQRP